MKTYQSSAICPKCGELLRTNNAKSYNFYCHHCKGRFRSNSIKDSDDELFRISIPATADEYEVHNEQLLEITEKYHCDFLGYDDGCGLLTLAGKKHIRIIQQCMLFLRKSIRYFLRKHIL